MLQTLPSRLARPAGAASSVTGAYKVDISRGERVGRVSSEWFSRPDDERFLSLGSLHAAVRARAERATARTVETKALRVEATDPAGAITGVHRTWLAPSGQTKAPVSTPRRSMGLINGQGVRIGAARGIVAVGEGLETMLSLRVALPDLPVIAAGSANHLDALLLSDGLRRLYVAEDDDPAGRRATASVMTRAEAAGIEAIRLAPARGDFNDDLRQLGREALHAALRVQLAPEDVERFWTPGRENARAA